jgi:hypothetical protein
MRLFVLRGLLLLAAAVLAGACGGAKTQPATTARRQSVDFSADLFVNPSFEDGDQPWFSLTSTSQGWGTPFTVSDAEAHSGKHSAYLEMRAGTEATGPQVFGVVQEITPAQFPEELSGYYRVDDWVRGTEEQYLQFVVIVFGATGLPGNYPNYQIRYPLAGIGEAPYDIVNARYLFVGKDQPVTGRWVYFERNIHDDFEQLWGAVPTSFQTIRILFEARYDDKTAGSGEVKADVFYDDLYVGPAGGNPNQPGG